MPGLPVVSAFGRDAGGSVLRAVARAQGVATNRALALLNQCLARDGFEAFYGLDKRCYLKHVATNTVAVAPAPDPHKAFSAVETAKRQRLSNYLDRASEDDLIEKILLPLFRQLGYRRITAAGHRDKALEYGKDVWMKYVLPTTHVL